VIEILPATAADLPAIREVLVSAFPTSAEADLVARICNAGHDELGLVALEDDRVVGHVLFSPVTVERDGAMVATGLGLAPVAVLPAYQRRGVGSELIRAGLEALQAFVCPWVVVLGEPEFYHRFGFVTASALGVQNEYGVDEPFMALELTPGVLPPGGGLVKYGEEFGELPKT
jgi:putative acetyltransferase